MNGFYRKRRKVRIRISWTEVLRSEMGQRQLRKVSVAR